MKHILSLAQLPPDHYVVLAEAAEELGWHGVHLADHVAMPATLKMRYPQRGKNWPETQLTPWPLDAPWIDCWVAFGAMSAVTSDLRFYTGIYVLPMRHPLHVAKAVGSVAALSGGRVVLGAGVGWLADEFDMVSESFTTRGRRMDEAIEIMRKVWAGRTAHQGEFYAFEQLDMLPRPDQPVPIYVGGESAPGLQRAATLADGFLSFPHRVETLRQLSDDIARRRNEAGRGDLPFEFVAMPTKIESLDDVAAHEHAGVDALIDRPWDELMNSCPIDAKIAAMRDWARVFIPR